MDIEGVAERLDNAAFTAKSTQQISQEQALTLAEAYQVQEQSIKRRYNRGEIFVGLKLGFTSKAKMEQMGVHDMIWGRLTDKMQYNAGDKLTRSDFIHPRAEPEIAFLLSKDITEELTLATAKDYISGVAVAIEIIDSRYEKFKFSLEDVIADNCSSAGFALGDWKPADANINNILMSLVTDDVIVGKGNSDAILGNPWESLVAAARLALANNVALKAGAIILAGAATPASYIKVGDTVSAHAEGLGSVYLDII